MAQPTEKYFGSLNLTTLRNAINAIPEKKGQFNSEDQFKIDAARWEDGNITLNVYDPKTKERFKLGNLRVSTFDDAPKQDATPAAPAADDLPF